MEWDAAVMSRFFLPASRVCKIFGLKIFSTVFLSIRNLEKNLQNMCHKSLFLTFESSLILNEIFYPLVFPLRVIMLEGKPSMPVMMFPMILMFQIEYFHKFHKTNNDVG